MKYCKLIYVLEVSNYQVGTLPEWVEQIDPDYLCPVKGEEVPEYAREWLDPSGEFFEKEADLLKFLAENTVDDTMLVFKEWTVDRAFESEGLAKEYIAEFNHQLFYGWRLRPTSLQVEDGEGNSVEVK